MCLSLFQKPPYAHAYVYMCVLHHACFTSCFVFHRGSVCMYVYNMCVHMCHVMLWWCELTYKAWRVTVQKIKNAIYRPKHVRSKTAHVPLFRQRDMHVLWSKSQQAHAMSSVISGWCRPVCFFVGVLCLLVRLRAYGLVGCITCCTETLSSSCSISGFPLRKMTCVPKSSRPHSLLSTACGKQHR